jgi:hypothetical protein
MIFLGKIVIETPSQTCYTYSRTRGSQAPTPEQPGTTRSRRSQESPAGNRKAAQGAGHRTLGVRYDLGNPNRSDASVMLFTITNHGRTIT